jgi:heptaprenyl diphosphate synthase
MKATKKMNTYRLTLMGLLFAVALVLTAVEYMIPPIPMLPPGVKLGLANVVIMYCLFFLGKKQALTIVFLKSGFVFLIQGFTAFLMSLSGGLLSAAVMMLLLALPGVSLSYLVISVFGAIFHNVGQLVVASFLLGTGMVVFYLPLLILSGVLMGYITGTLLKIVIPAFDRIDISQSYGAKTARRSTIKKSGGKL